MEIPANESEVPSNRSDRLGNLVSVSLAMNLPSEKKAPVLRVTRTDGKTENNFCNNTVVLKLVVALL